MGVETGTSVLAELEQCKLLDIKNLYSSQSRESEVQSKHKNQVAYAKE